MNLKTQMQALIARIDAVITEAESIVPYDDAQTAEDVARIVDVFVDARKDLERVARRAEVAA